MTLPSKVLWLVGAPFRLALLGMIRAYRFTFGALAVGRCRFHPSCSAYAAEAVVTRGALVGSGLAVWRVLRCNPLSRGGIDPAPARRTTTSYGGLTSRTPSYKEGAIR